MSQIQNGNTMIIPALCKDGFDPTTLIEAFTNEQTGVFQKNLALVFWFRLTHPEGKIAQENERNDSGTVCRATARVYTKFDAPEDHYLAKASCEREPDEEGRMQMLDSIQSSALCAALENAGFIIPGIGEDRSNDQVPGNTASRPALQIVPELASAVNNSVESSVSKIDSPAAQSSEEAVQPPTDVGQSQEVQIPEAETLPLPLVPMTYEQACGVQCPLPQHKGITLGVLAAKDPSSLEYLARRSSDKEVKEAANIILEKARAVAAG